jgi:type I restriction enzyme M protein
MESPRNKLDQIWVLFGKAGVLDDLLIIEYIAALLLQNHVKRPASKLLRPRLPDIPPLDLARVKELLSEAADGAGSAAELFDRYTVFYLSRRLAGARFPTPRHIVDCLLNIIQIKPKHSVADFACGSGGYLVHAARSNQPFDGEVTGVEVSLEWARLAWANAALHGIKNFRIELGNSFQVLSSGGALYGQTYDRILMSPPFGELVDEKLVSKVLKQKAGTRSETAFVALALQSLAARGRAAVLVSSTFLFTKGGGETRLRKQLAGKGHLDAVIALPQSALEPFSDTRAYALFINKVRGARKDHQIWFFRTENDGYPPGRSRELTEHPPPSSINDLKLVEKVILSSEPYSTVKLQNNVPIALVKSIRLGADNFLGIVVEAPPRTELLAVESFSLSSSVDKGVKDNKGTKFVIVEIKDSIGEVHSVRIRTETGDADIINKRFLLQELYSWKVGDPSPGLLLLESEHRARAVAISTDGKLLGTEIPHAAVAKNYYDLRPEEYLPDPLTSLDQTEESVTHQSAATLLSNIRSDQQRFLQSIENILGQLEARHPSEMLLPAPLLKRLRILNAFSREQKRIWKRVLRTGLEVEEEGRKYMTGRPFTQNEIIFNGGESDPILVHATIDLLEAVGAIVRITIPHPETEMPAPLYRLATDRDEWLFEREAVALKGDET